MSKKGRGEKAEKGGEQIREEKKWIQERQKSEYRRR